MPAICAAMLPELGIETNARSRGRSGQDWPAIMT
jgi:hypothetical protein